MIVSVKDILLYSDSIIPKIYIIFIYVLMITAVLYGSKKHHVSEIVKSPSSAAFLLIIFTESFWYTFTRYFPDTLVLDSRIIFYAESVIFGIAVIISLIDEKYYANTFPVTICRIAVYTIGLSLILFIIEFIYIVVIIAGSLILFTAAVWSAVDSHTFKENIIFWRKKT